MGKGSEITFDQISEEFQSIQDSICRALEETDGQASFQEDKWEREGGGGGKTRVVTSGAIMEKGGVNFSGVFGKMDAKIASELGMKASDFAATGVSIVIHPKNPHVPIIHMNIRYFELDEDTWWFGGGIDLTPHWIVDNQAAWFHQQLQSACQKHDTSYYQRFKQWADEYFYLPHRNETRGVGGIFFDRLNTKNEGKSKQEIFEFVKEVGNAFAPIYTELMVQNATKSISQEDLDWQKVRRSRYVEFNLIYDRGTTFGLKSNGRTESILMSLPPDTGWEYNRQYTAQELETIEKLKQGINWVERT